MSEQNMWEIEESLYSDGLNVICGVDEAGRGPLAGPVYAAAVILPPNLEIPGLTDSKKLSDKKRRELFPVIQEQAVAYGIRAGDRRNQYFAGDLPRHAPGTGTADRHAGPGSH